MADREYYDEDRDARAKRQKTGDSDPKMNPYLAHMYDGQNSGNGYKKEYASGAGMGWGKMPRHNTTADMAIKAEDGPNNAFNRQPLSQKYFNILKSRRNLPVHAQRYDSTPDYDKLMLTGYAGTNSFRCIKSRKSSYSWARPVPAKPPKFHSLSFSMISRTSSANWLPVRNLVE